MKTVKKIDNLVSKETMNKFVNLMYLGYGPEIIKHKMNISSEMLESIHQIYFNKSK